MPPPPHQPRVDRALAVAAALVLTLMAAVLVRGDGPGADTIFWAPGAVNGVSAADLPVVAVWAVAVLGCLAGLRGHRGVLVLVAAVLSFLALTLLKGDGPDSGPTILQISGGYGVNAGDLPVVAAWAAGVASCAALWWRRGRTR